MVTPTTKSRIPIGILLFLCNQQDLNLRTSFQTASQYGAAVWEKPPAEVSIMSGNQSHSDHLEQVLKPALFFVRFNFLLSYAKFYKSHYNNLF